MQIGFSKYSILWFILMFFFFYGFLAGHASRLKCFFLFRGNTVVEVNHPLNPDSTFYEARDNARKEMSQFIGDVLW